MLEHVWGRVWSDAQITLGSHSKLGINTNACHIALSAKIVQKAGAAVR